MARHQSPAPTGKVPTGAILTKHLKELALYVETLDDEGNPVTRAKRLAELVWQYALGFEEKDLDDNNKIIRRRPEQWAIMLIYERLEGRSPVAQPDSTGKTVAERVSDLGKSKINDLLGNTSSEVLVLGPVEPEPPRLKRPQGRPRKPKPDIEIDKAESDEL